jgi:hypothetical protein
MPSRGLPPAIQPIPSRWPLVAAGALAALVTATVILRQRDAEPVIVPQGKGSLRTTADVEEHRTLQDFGHKELPAAVDSVSSALPHSLQESDDGMRLEAIADLSASGDVDSWQWLSALAIQDANPTIRSEAAFRLGEIGGSKSAQTIERVLEDPDDKVRATAVDALTLLDASDATAPLIRALGHSDPAVRRAAANGLEDIRVAPSATCASLRR